MKIDGTYTFDAPRDAVWEALLDPEVLASVMPGCEKLDKTGDNAYEGALKIKVGPVQGLFNGKVKLSDIDAPNGYTMKVDGRGAPGFVQADSTVALAEQGEQTEMTYGADAKVGGRIASVGQRLLDSSAKAIIKQSLEGLNTVVKARVAAQAGQGVVVDGAGDGDTDGEADAPAPVEAPAYEKPSQADFAKAVAKEVASDLVPKQYRIPLVAGLIAALAAIFWFFFA